MKQESFTPVIVEGSPVEFVLVGLFDGEERVVVSSNNVGIDLLGFAACNKAHIVTMSNAPRPSWLFWAFPRTREIWGARAIITSAESENSDDRPLEYRLCWVGKRDEEFARHIESVFKVYMSSIYQSLVDHDPSRVLWHLSPVLLEYVSLSRAQSKLNNPLIQELQAKVVAAEKLAQEERALREQVAGEIVKQKELQTNENKAFGLGIACGIVITIFVLIGLGVAAWYFGPKTTKGQTTKPTQYQPSITVTTTIGLLGSSQGQGPLLSAIVLICDHTQFNKQSITNLDVSRDSSKSINDKVKNDKD